MRKQLSAVELEALLHLLSETEQRLTQRLSEALATEGASVAQWRVLAVLANGPGQPMSELARYTLLPAPSLTRVIDGMVLGGLVHRTVDAEDRRRVLVHLTRAGRARRRRLAERIQLGQDAILTPHDVARLQEVVDHVTGRGGADRFPAAGGSRRSSASRAEHA